MISPLKIDDEGTDGIQCSGSSFVDDFHDIYYQYHYKLHPAFSYTVALAEILSLCTNIDRLQQEESDIYGWLQAIRKYFYMLTKQSNDHHHHHQGQTREECGITYRNDKLQLKQEIIEKNSCGNS